jgi:formylglycine-generating enzyme required for sulfatase activity
MGSPEDEPLRDPDEGPVRKVAVSRFWIGRAEVSWDEYMAFFRETGSPPGTKVAQLINLKDVDAISGPTPPWGAPDQGWGKGARPAITMTWYAANVYCEWLSRITGKKYRLPTEAEWEYAARGPKSLKFPWGDKWDAKEIKANVADASLRRAGFNMEWGEIKEDDGYLFTSPGGAFRNASWCGAFDMAGNVWQWCNDWYGQGYYSVSPAVDPTGPDTGTPMPDGKSYRVLRGGNWYNGDGSDPNIHILFSLRRISPGSD